MIKTWTPEEIETWDPKPRTAPTAGTDAIITQAATALLMFYLETGELDRLQNLARDLITCGQAALEAAGEVIDGLDSVQPHGSEVASSDL